MANGQQIEGLPAGATLKPIEGLPAGAELRPVGGSTPTDTRNSFQQGVDALTETEPANKRPGVGGALTTAASNIGAGFMSPLSMVAHPIATAKGIGRSIANPYDPQGALSGMASGLKENPVGTLETLPGQAAVAAVPGLLKAGGSALRSAAIGDPDAAALRALNVPPKSPRVQSTLNAVERTRPYVAGAKNLEDLQSRISPAKQEIFDPYQQAVGNIGNRPVQGPSGPTDVAGLEAERQQFSAINRGLKSKMPNPEAVRLAEQKGMGQAEALQHEKNIKSVLDPELASTGIKPGATRATYGGVAKVGERVSGRSTVGEESQPYGFGKLRNLDITKPLQAVPTLFDAGRDVVAGRPLFSGKPTDVAVRDAFRYGGPKPDLGTLRAPNLSAPRPVGPLGLPANAGPIQLGGRIEGTPPPAYRYDTTTSRLGRLLPEPSLDTPLSSHPDIFPEQRPGSNLLRRPRTIEGQR